MIHHWSGRISGGDTDNRYGHLTDNGGRRVRVFITFHIHDGEEVESSSPSTTMTISDYDVDMDVEGEVTIAVAGVSTRDSAAPMMNHGKGPRMDDFIISSVKSYR
ncbi:hypothetical protein H5410_011523 [Solanum commersonii]|uniref:Uncharacterized protein n=1 Tax=Solanum commersonii TaxID=4109 RepID=A0A9J6APP9_SOLCO|nr:hypothetical protein H5410_011523 [Solanum commersonii]